MAPPIVYTSKWKTAVSPQLTYSFLISPGCQFVLLRTCEEWNRMGDGGIQWRQRAHIEDYWLLSWTWCGEFWHPELLRHHLSGCFTEWKRSPVAIWLMVVPRLALYKIAIPWPVSSTQAMNWPSICRGCSCQRLGIYWLTCHDIACVFCLRSVLRFRLWKVQQTPNTLVVSVLVATHLEFTWTDVTQCKHGQLYRRQTKCTFYS
jgi:hypothetical protein